MVRMTELQLKDNVALIVLLRPRETAWTMGRRLPCIAFANTHLLFNPKRGDIKALLLIFCCLPFSCTDTARH